SEWLSKKKHTCSPEQPCRRSNRSCYGARSTTFLTAGAGASRLFLSGGADLMRLRYHGGTLVLDDATLDIPLPRPFQWVKGKPRCPACHYAGLAPWLEAQTVRD